MYFLIVCNDKPGHAAKRLENRPAHRLYLERLNQEGKIAFSGPLIDAAGEHGGSMIVVRVPDEHSAQAIVENDPFSLCGLFASVEVRQWHWGMNAP